MAQVYPWPVGWLVERFDMRILGNTRVFESPYGRTIQAIDLIGEFWRVSFDLPFETNFAIAAAREAFFDRLAGPVNYVELWHFGRPQPYGTLRETDAGAAQWKTGAGANATWQTTAPAPAGWAYGGPQLAAAVPQLSNVWPIACVPGRTLLVGDHIKIGTQLLRAMASATAGADGVMQLEAIPRARTAIIAGLAVFTNKPTARFYMKGDGVPLSYRSGMTEGASIEFEEAP